MNSDRLIFLGAALAGIWLFMRGDDIEVVAGDELLGPPLAPTSSGVELSATRHSFPAATLPRHVTLQEAATWVQYYKVAFSQYFSFLPTEVVLGQIKVESDFNPRAKGGIDEMGLLQVRASTWQDVAKKYSKKAGYTFQQMMDPNDWPTQILVGMFYMYEVSTFIKTTNLEFVLQGYNVGPTGFLHQGKTNTAYAQRVLGWAGVYYQPITTTSPPANGPLNESPGDFF